ncbi:MAG: YdcF family protein [Acidobacteria bacterium]|nr:YdcF family protein [Acidobacteriota bacterium]
MATERRSRWRRRLLLALLFAVLAAGALLRYGGYRLVAPDPLPAQADVAVALFGSFHAQRNRTAEALRLLEQGRVRHVVLSVGSVSLYGEWVPELARRYVQENYGEGISQRVLVCAKNAGSTGEEAVATRRCLEGRGWRSVVVVTSNFHTRRARWLWKEALAGSDPPFTVVVHGVPDVDFEPDGWWRNRRHAKTWVAETARLVWSFFEGIPDSPPTNVEIR